MSFHGRRGARCISCRPRTGRPSWRSPGAALLLVLLVAAGCGTSDEPAPGGTPGAGTERVAVGDSSYTRVTPATLAATLAERDVVLVNVHVPYEGEIEGTDQFIPYDEVGSRTEELAGRTEPIVVYCLTGRMSALAAATLVELGYTDVTELGGGMAAWRAAGLPLVDGRS